MIWSHLGGVKYLGLDIGGTSIKIGHYDSHGRELYTERIDTASWKGSFRQNLIHFLGEQTDVAGVGLGVPGLLSRDRKQAIFVEVLPELDNVPLIAPLEDALPGVQFGLENDAMCAALGLRIEDPALGENFLYVGLGTGLGAGAVLDGKPFLGGLGNALELGFVPADEGKWIEYHLLVGRQVERLISAGYIDATPQRLNEYMARTDLEVVQLLRSDIQRHLIRGLAPAVVILDVRTIVIGGGNSPTDAHFYSALRQNLCAVLPNVYHDLTIERVRTGPFVAALGAASLVLPKGE